MNCPYCSKLAIWCENKEIYGKNYGKSYMVYLCKDCDAYVGCHKNSEIPLGTMATRELRTLRNKVHKLIDPLWQEKGMNRKEMYKILNDYFGKQIHVAESNEETCTRIIEEYNQIF